MPTNEPDAPTGTGIPVLDITDAARAVVLDARASESDADNLALWVEVTGVNGASFTYDIYFQASADAAPGDAVHDLRGLPVVIPAASAVKLRGARLDFSDEGDGGLVIVNPNVPPRADYGLPDDAELSSDLAQRIIAVLDEQVNPSIAMHGGRAELAGVSAGTAYLMLSGGCQGCGLAKVTLSQGIEVALRDAVPEIVSVVDVTDHASGTNPYFEGAKK